MIAHLDWLTITALVCQFGILGVWVVISRHASALKILPDRIALMTQVQKKWPKVSILIPALNEAQTIEPALNSLLQIDYPNYEVIVINDRSTDDTGAIIDRIAAKNSRITAIHIETLPDGWLGKVHALDRGLERSDGDFVLCTDADVHFTPDALKRSIAFMQHRSLDHLALLPKIKPAGILFDVAMTQAAWLLFFFINPRTIGTDKARMPMGVGAFNLIRGPLIRQLQPFKKLRLEVVDDIGLAILCHQAGGTGSLQYAGDAISLEYYASYGAMLKGLEKNTFAFSQYSALRSLAENLTIMVTPICAFVVPAILGGSVIRMMAAVTYLLAATLQWRSMITHGVKLHLIPFFPVGMFLTGIAGLRSMIQTIRRGGITWRGTFYELSELRKMQITKIPISISPSTNSLDRSRPRP